MLLRVWPKTKQVPIQVVEITTHFCGFSFNPLRSWLGEVFVLFWHFCKIKISRLDLDVSDHKTEIKKTTKAQEKEKTLKNSSVEKKC